MVSDTSIIVQRDDCGTYRLKNSSRLVHSPFGVHDIIEGMDDEDTTYDPYVADLASTEELVAVLRGHLHLEILLGELLLLRFPGGDAWLHFVQFSDTVRLARREGLIPSDYARSLRQVGELRNTFAHPPIKTVLSDEDATKFVRAFPDVFEKHILQTMHSHREASKTQETVGISPHGMIFRMGMAFLHAGLSFRIKQYPNS